MSKAEAPPFFSIMSKSFRSGSDIFFSVWNTLNGPSFSETAKRFLSEESWVPSPRYFYRCIPKPLTTSENFVLHSEAFPCPFVWDLVVLLLQTWSFALSFNGIVVSPGCPSSFCVPQAQKCSLANCLLESSERAFSDSTVFLQQKTLSHMLITSWESEEAMFLCWHTVTVTQRAWFVWFSEEQHPISPVLGDPLGLGSFSIVAEPAEYFVLSVPCNNNGSPWTKLPDQLHACEFHYATLLSITGCLKLLKERTEKKTSGMDWGKRSWWKTFANRERAIVMKAGVSPQKHHHEEIPERNK